MWPRELCSNAMAIGRLFNLFPESVFLVAYERSVELQDEDGVFKGCLTGVDL